MNKTFRNLCLCQADALEGPTQNSMPSMSQTQCSSVTYPQPTASENPYAFSHMSLLTQGFSTFVNTGHLLSTTPRESNSEGLRYVLVSLLKKQIRKTPQMILLYIKRLRNPTLNHIFPTSAYKIYFLNPVFILVIFYLMDFIHNLVIHLIC